MGKDKALRVRDLYGNEDYLRAEVDVLGIGGDVRACARFDAAFLEQLAQKGIHTANRLKDEAGLASATAQSVMNSPRSMSNRVFIVIVANVGLDADSIVKSATSDNVRAGFDAEHEAVTKLLYQLGQDFLKLDMDKQVQAVKLVRALKGRLGRAYCEGTETHVAACGRLTEQIEELAYLKPTQTLEAVEDAEWDVPRVRWVEEGTGNIITDLSKWVEDL